MRTTPSAVATILALTALMAGSPLSAACGGGGGSGPGYGSSTVTPQIDPTYTPTSTAFPTTASSDTDTAAASSAETAQGRVLVVLQKHRTPIGIWDEPLAALSKKDLPFVKYEDGDAAQFAQRWGIQAVPAVALCDRRGNVLAVTSFPVTARNVHFIIDHANEESAQLGKTLDALNLSAERAVTNHHFAVAFENFAKITLYHGLPACAKASTLEATLIQQGRDSINQAQNADAMHARSQLDQLISSYRGTVVADEAKLAVRQLQ